MHGRVKALQRWYDGSDLTQLCNLSMHLCIYSRDAILAGHGPYESAVLNCLAQLEDCYNPWAFFRRDRHTGQSLYRCLLAFRSNFGSKTKSQAGLGRCLEPQKSETFSEVVIAQIFWAMMQWPVCCGQQCCCTIIESCGHTSCVSSDRRYGL